MSIAPKWVQKILDGKKQVELRRRGPSPKYIGNQAYIYATRPKSAIVARCLIADITVGEPNGLWSQIGSVSGCTQTEFFDYFSGAPSGTALRLASVSPVEEMPLKLLMDEFSWRPPISWCRISEESNLARYLRSR